MEVSTASRVENALDHPAAPHSTKGHTRSPSEQSSLGPLPRDLRHDFSNQTASPEVISSLISSLSSISTPVENHFNSMPKVEASHMTTPSIVDNHWPGEPPPIPRRKHTQRKVPVQTRSVSEYDSYEPISDAAIAPVVRLVKPSSSIPDLSTNRLDSPSAVKYRGSHQSLKISTDAISIGMISTEQPRPYAPSIASSTKSNRSWRAKVAGSKEAPDQDQVRSRRNGGIFEKAANTFRPLSPPRGASESALNYARRSSQSISPVGRTSVSPVISSSPVDTVQSTSLVNSGIVPSRGSSLRHSVGSSMAPWQSRASHIRHSVGSRDLRDLNIDPDLIAQDNQTVRRIRELHEAKEKREREEKREARRTERSKSNQSNLRTNPPPHRTLFHNSHHLVTSDGLQKNTIATDSDVNQTPDFSPVIREKSNLPGPLGVASGNVQKPMNGVTHDQDDDTENSHIEQTTTPSKVSQHTQAIFGPRAYLQGIDTAENAASVDEAVDAYLKAPRLTQRARHPGTGRVIAFSEVGDSNGFAVICCVGMGLTRYLTAYYDELAFTLKLRLITLDRPGVGESEPCLDGSGTPLNWADDVTVVCNHLGISRFSLLAHSAGAVYALATALQLPQNIRGRIHLMAPWIPPSQMTAIGNSLREPLPATNLPYSQKLLRLLPTSFFKAANSSFLSARSASLTNKTTRSRAVKRRSLAEASTSPGKDISPSTRRDTANSSPTPGAPKAASNIRTESPVIKPLTHGFGVAPSKQHSRNSLSSDTATRSYSYDDRLTQCIWDFTTTNANPAVDLITCLERRQPIGFKYVDVTRSVVIHHGSKDTRVPVENVKWLGKIMRRCEVRILEGEGHGLMANAAVMGAVLGEIAKEWEDWWVVTQGKRDREKERGEE